MEGPDAVTQNIRNSPLHMTASLAPVQHSRLRATVASIYPTMTTQTTTQTTTQASTTTTKATPISKIHDSFSKGLKRTSYPGGGSRGGGGGGSMAVVEEAVVEEAVVEEAVVEEAAELQEEPTNNQ
jgi:hypothetical protein